MDIHSIGVILEGYETHNYKDSRRRRLNNNLEKKIYYKKIWF